MGLHRDGGPLSALPFTPAYDFDNFASTFEDPFAYSGRPFEPTPHADSMNEESSPQELDNKLLGFSDPIMNASVVDDTGKFADVNMGAELYGMFFVAEDVFGGETAGRPLELTCYRRNLWQCSGQLTLPKNISHVVDEQGRQLAVEEIAASITAVESIEGKATEIISIPWKSSNPQTGASVVAANGGGEDAKVASAPPHIQLDLGNAQEVDAHRVNIPVAWKRLQFKHATANNGRRKGLQQHYVVQINLLGKSKATNEIIKIAEIQSGPVIVRGRSPRNFDSRKDVPLTGEKRLERKNTASSDNATLKTERENLQATMQRYQSMSSVAVSLPGHNQGDTADLSLQTPAEWGGQGMPQPNHSPHPSKRIAVSPTVARPPVPPWSADGSNAGHKQTPTAHRGSMSRHNSTVPINLSLSEDEKSPNRSSTELSSPQMGKAHPAVGQNAGNSPSDDPDPLYEYFPLTVDDWYVKRFATGGCKVLCANMILGCRQWTPFTGHTSFTTRLCLLR